MSLRFNTDKALTFVSGSGTKRTGGRGQGVSTLVLTSDKEVKATQEKLL
jgi:hypothetical protein